MDCNKIHYFLKCAELMSFTKAADSLYISRQALSKQIVKLEDELGVRLLERDTKNVELTEVGQKVYKDLAPVFYELQRTYDNIRDYCRDSMEKIKVGFFIEINDNFVRNILLFFGETFKGSPIEPIMMDLHEIKYLLYDKKIDICFTYLVNDEKWVGCDMSVLNLQPAQIMVSKQHPWAKKRSITQEDLRGEEFIMLKGTHEDKDRVYNYMPCKKQVWVPNIQSSLMRIGYGKGFAITSKYGNCLDDPRYIGFDVPGFEVEFKLACLWRNDEKRHNVLAFIDYINANTNHFKKTII